LEYMRSGLEIERVELAMGEWLDFFFFFLFELELVRV
jgi:hypothetical protein